MSILRNVEIVSVIDMLAEGSVHQAGKRGFHHYQRAWHLKYFTKFLQPLFSCKKRETRKTEFYLFFAWR